ncbi:Uncharacterised protein [Bordetella pertussis]|nr:Uncharacterised protein [Bordetella pertussis]
MAFWPNTTPISSERKVVSVRPSSSYTSAVTWSTLDMGQRVHGLTNAMRTPPATMQAVWSSSKAGQSPSTTILARKRFIGTGAWPRAARRSFSSSSDDWLATSSGNPSAKPKKWSPAKSSAHSGWRSSQVSTHSGLAVRSARRSILSRRHGSPRKRLSHSALRGCSARAITVSRHTPTGWVRSASSEPSAGMRKSSMPGARSTSMPSSSAVRMRAICGYWRWVMNWPAAVVTIQRRSCARPARSTIDSARSMPAQDLTG